TLHLGREGHRYGGSARGRRTHRREGRVMSEAPAILDACGGPRMFWFDRADQRALFVDKRREVCTADTREGRRQIVVNPDVLADFKSLPFSDATFTLVVFDP